jgi:hypothetical protein
VAQTASLPWARGTSLSRPFTHGLFPFASQKIFIRFPGFHATVTLSAAQIFFVQRNLEHLGNAHSVSRYLRRYEKVLRTANNKSERHLRTFYLTLFDADMFAA